jgi:hypothetical protein
MMEAIKEAMATPAVLGLLIAVALYPLLIWRLNRYMRPRRVRLAELGAALSRDKRLSETERASIHAMLDNAVSAFTAIGVMLVVPIAGTTVLARRAILGRPSRPAWRETDAGATHDEFVKLYFTSISAANPACGLILWLELGVFVVLALLVGATSNLMQDIRARSATSEIGALEFLKNHVRLSH